MEFILGRRLTKQRKQFLQANDKLYGGMEFLQKTLDLPLNTETIKQTDELMMEDEKDVLAEEYKKSPGLQVIIFLHQRVTLKDTWKTQFLGFMRLKKMIQLWPLQIFLETLSISIHLKMETEEFMA